MLEKTLESPSDSREINQSILKEKKSQWSLEGLMLKFQYLGHLMQRADLLETTLILGKIEGKKRKGLWMRWLDGIIDSMDKNLSKSGRKWRTEKFGLLHSMGSQRVRHNLVIEQQQITCRKPNLSCGSQFVNSCLRQEKHDNTESPKENFKINGGN